MTTRLFIVRKAKWEANAYESVDGGHWKPTSDEMTEIFTVAGLAAPSKADLERFKSASGNIVLGSKYDTKTKSYVGGQSIAWCGIFATYVLKKWGGLDVKWVWGDGIKGAGVNKTWDHSGMRPGDVAIVRGKLNAKGQAVHHHFIITDIDYSENTMQSVDGNSTNDEIVWHKNKKIVYSGADNASYTPYCHYKLSI
ncbi:MAG: hypothetical protein V4660_16655 [Pseudomonadota bacterium]